MSPCVCGDGWHLLIHFPRQLFVKLCLVFTARMCHERFCWSAVDSWADPGTLRLTGSACLNVECSSEDRAPNQPSDLHCVESTATKHLYPSLDAAYPWTDSGHNRDQKRLKHSWVLPSSGQAPHEAGKFSQWRVSSMFFVFFFYITLPTVLQFKQWWINTSEVNAATLLAV